MLLPTGSLVDGQWGRFQIKELLGRGGFGEVYRAYDPKLDREVALKLAHPQVSGDAAHSLREGRHLAKIRHPNVVTVYDVGDHEGRVGIGMELVKGETLEESLRRRGPFEESEVVEIGIALCRALAGVHQQGILHRDIKAQNVIRQVDGRIVLVDFGVGLDQSRPEPGHDGVAGTQHYIAPEVLAGEPSSPASDLHSLGVLLFRLTTGGFPGRTEFASPAQSRPPHGASTSVRLANLLQNLIAPKPVRYRSAEEAKEALENLGREGAPLWKRLAIASIILAVLTVSVRLLLPFAIPGYFVSKDVRIAVAPVLEGGDQGLRDRLEEEFKESSGVELVGWNEAEEFRKNVCSECGSWDLELASLWARYDGAVGVVIVDEYGARLFPVNRAGRVGPLSAFVSLAPNLASFERRPWAQSAAIRLRRSGMHLGRQKHRFRRLSVSPVHNRQALAAFMNGIQMDNPREAATWFAKARMHDPSFLSAYYRAAESLDSGSYFGEGAGLGLAGAVRVDASIKRFLESGEPLPCDAFLVRFRASPAMGLSEFEIWTLVVAARQRLCYDAALQLLGAASSDWRSAIEAYRQIALILERKGPSFLPLAYEEALRILEGDHDPINIGFLAFLEALMGRGDEALRRLAENTDDHIDYWFWPEGLAHVANGDFAKAERAFRKLEASKCCEFAALFRVQLARKRGNLDRARNLLEEFLGSSAVSARPSSTQAEAWLMLAELHRVDGLEDGIAMALSNLENLDPSPANLRYFRSAAVLALRSGLGSADFFVQQVREIHLKAPSNVSVALLAQVNAELLLVEPMADFSSHSMILGELVWFDESLVGTKIRVLERQGLSSEALNLQRTLHSEWAIMAFNRLSV
ncbi:MAG: protein kinase [Acidobacteriota bacterium]